MPDIIGSALATDGIWWLMGAVFIAGLVRGFSGFGSAMIIMSVASSVLSPIAAVTFLVLAEIPGPLPNLPSALRDGTPKDALRLLLGAALALPVGLSLLSVIAPDMFAILVSCVVIILLALTMTGWRYRGVLHPRLISAVGAAGGFLGGLAGIAGPPVIMFYLSTPLPAKTIRANLLLYLLGFDLLLLPILYFLDGFMIEIAVLGLIAGIPNVIGNMLGARLFDPNAERLFRNCAYLVIGVTAIVGLPIW